MPSGMALNYLATTMDLPNVDEVKEQKLVEVESEPTQKTEDTEAPVEETQKEPQEAEPAKEKSDEGEGEQVPVSFQKRIDKLTYLYKSEREARIKAEEMFRAKRENPNQPTTEEEKKEQAARDYLKGLYHEIAAEEKKKEAEEDARLHSEIEHVSAIYPDFDRKKVLEFMEKSGISDVEKAYQTLKEFGRSVQEEKEKTKKEIIAKPKSPSSVKTQDSLATKFSPEDIKSKTMWELTDQLKKEAGL